MNASRWPPPRSLDGTLARLDQPTVLGVMADLDLDVVRSLPAASARAEEAAPPSARPRPLPEGARLLDFDIVGLLGEGGFGIVYLAYDRALERHVAIKEYLPASLAARVGGTPVVAMLSPRHADAFQIGLRSFINEARLLARFDHPSLVKVLRFWEGNGTAYMVMPFYEGSTLAHTLRAMDGRPDEAQLRAWLRPLLHALSTLHAARCFHRDIAPDNILLTPAGPLLLDFGAARRVVGSRGEAPTVVFKPGYAPIEQYGEAPTLKQGPWTDLYALAAVVYAAVTGRPPLPALERWRDDRHQPLAGLAQGRYSDAFLETIDAALSLQPGDRPVSAAAFWHRLNGPAQAVAPLGTAAPEAFAVVPGDAVEAAAARSVVRLPPARTSASPSSLRQAPNLGTVAAPATARRARLGVLLILLLALAVAWGLSALHGRPAVDDPPAASLPARSMLAPPAVEEAGQAATPTGPVIPEKSSGETALADPAAVPDAPVPPQTGPRPSAVARPAALQAAGPSAREAQTPGKPSPRSVAATAADADTATATARRRCTEILQRASIEPIRSAEAAFLKRECRP